MHTNWSDRREKSEKRVPMQWGDERAQMHNVRVRRAVSVQCATAAAAATQ